jgi:hypothetical protein
MGMTDNCCSSVQIRSTSRSPSSCIVVVRLRDVAVVGGLSYTTPLPLLGEKSRWFVREVKLALHEMGWNKKTSDEKEGETRRETRETIKP